jgi:hypothetical protein
MRAGVFARPDSQPARQLLHLFQTAAGTPDAAPDVIETRPSPNGGVDNESP